MSNLIEFPSRHCTAPTAQTGLEAALENVGRLLIMIDEDNWRISLHSQCATRVDYKALDARLRATGRKVDSWAICTADPGDQQATTEFARLGWKALTMPRETVHTSRGQERKANADFDLALAFGASIASHEYDAVILGTGDGDLGVALARATRRIQPSARVVVMGIQGCTSHRLFDPKLVDTTLLLGKDLMNPGELHNIPRSPVSVTATTEH